MHMCALLCFSRTLWSQKPASISSLLFAVHPVHTEAVAGLVGRADIGACFFMIASILLYSKSTMDFDKLNQSKIVSLLYVFCAW